MITVMDPALMPPTYGPPPLPTPRRARRWVGRLLVALALVVIVGLAVAAGQLYRDGQAQRKQLADERDSTRALTAQLATAQEDATSLQQRLDSAPTPATCSAVRFGTSWADPDEHTMVICGPHAKEARDAIVEYRVSHSDAASYLQSKYPLNQVLLDATFNAR